MSSGAKPAVVAVDIGSSFIKASLVETDGTVAAASHVPLPYAKRGNAREIDASALWGAFAESVARLEIGKSGSADIRGVGITSQMAGLAALDERYEPLRPFIPGVDPRGAAYVPLLRGAFGAREIHARTGCPLLGIYPAAKLLALRAEEPELLGRAAYIGGIKEYLLWRLTGAWVTDPASASVTQLYDQAACGWWPELLDAVSVSAGMLPRIAEPDDMAGPLSAAAAAELGLPAGLPVAVGTGDGPAANWSTGAVTERDMCVSLGTTAVIRIVTHTSRMISDDPSYFRQQFSKRMYLQGYRMERAGSHIESALAAGADANTAHAPASGGPVYFNPLASAEENPFVGDAGGVSAGARLEAVLDGILFTLYGVIRPAWERRAFGSIRPIGGGASNIRWMKNMADLFQVPVVLTGGDSTVGAAMILLKGIGAFADWSDAVSAMVRPERTIEPDASAAEAMLRRREAYESAMGRGNRR